MLWVAAPPSDQLVNLNCSPSVRFCRAGALIELFDPTITVRVNGATCVVLPTVSCAPVGLDWNVSTTVRGFSRTVVVPTFPSESVARSVRSKKDGYSWSGATKLPDATPLNAWTLCAWQFVGVVQCCNVSCQLNADAGSGPSCASDAAPANGTVCPTDHC